MRNFLFVFSGPSAVGKTTVANAVLKHYEELSREKKKSQNSLQSESEQSDFGRKFESIRYISRIVTCTTRNRREGEVDGVDYIFLTKEEFLQRKDRGEFAEFSEVYGNYYGVLFSTIRGKIDSKENSLLVINWEGFFKIKEKFGEQVVGIFIAPPSLETLENRIRSRRQDSEEIIRRRMKAVADDMQHKDEFEYCVENDVLNKTVDKVIEILNGYLNM